jgi:hypothetical protein
VPLGRNRPTIAVLALLAIAGLSHADNDNGDDVARLSESFRRLPPGERSRYLTQSFAFMNVNRMDGYEPLFGGGPRPDRSTPPLPFPSGSEGVDPLLGSPLQFLFDPIRLGQEALADRGLKLGIYELLVGQAVTDAAPGTRSALGSSRFDLRLDALAWRPEGLGTGRFCIQFRQNNAMPGGASDLANSVGSVTALDEPLASISTKLVRCHFSQGFLDDRLTVIAYQAGTVGVVAQALVLPWLYVNAQCVSAGHATEAYFEETFGQGWVFVAQQFLGPELGVWFQAAGATAGVWRSGGRTRSRPGNGCRTRSRRTTGFRSRGRCR